MEWFKELSRLSAWHAAQLFLCDTVGQADLRRFRGKAEAIAKDSNSV